MGSTVIYPDLNGNVTCATQMILAMNFIICLNVKILLSLAQDKTAYQEYFVITLMHINSLACSIIPISMLSVMFVN